MSVTLRYSEGSTRWSRRCFGLPQHDTAGFFLALGVLAFKLIYEPRTMKRLLIQPAHADLETDRTIAALTHRGGDVIALRQDSPASPMIDLLNLRKRIRRYDIVHAFGGPALAVAVGATNRPVVFSPIGFPTRSLIAWVRAVCAYRHIDIACSSDAARRAMVTRGVPIDRTHLVRPGVNLSTIPTGRNTELRTRLGFSDSDSVLFCPLEITHTSGHRAAIWAASILSIIRPQYKLLLWGRGPASEAMNDLRTRVLDSSIIRFATDLDPTIEVEPLFAVADAVLLTPASPIPTLPVAMAMASSKPIVATVTTQLCELLEDRHTALLVNGFTPRVIGHRIMDLFADTHLAWQLHDRARAEVYDHLTQAKFIELFRQLYERVAGSNQLTDSPTLSNPSLA